MTTGMLLQFCRLRAPAAGAPSRAFGQRVRASAGQASWRPTRAWTRRPAAASSRSIRSQQVEMLARHPAARRRDRCRTTRRPRGSGRRRSPAPAAITATGRWPMRRGRRWANERGARPCRPRRRPRGGERGAAPPALHAGLALGERARLLRHADERADDLQRPSAALLGAVRRQLRSGLAADRGRARVAATSGSARLSLDTTGVLGTRTVQGVAQNRAFPGWATIPSYYDLALARRGT